MKVALLGAGGRVARSILYDLLTQPHLESLLMAGRRYATLERARDEMEAYNARLVEVDIRDVQETATYLKDYDLTINCAQYYHNIDAMRACLEAGTDYMDMGGLYHTSLRQLGLHGDFRAERRKAILGMGSSPGTTNVFARYAANWLDTLNTLRLRSGIMDNGEGSLAILMEASSSLGTLLDQVWLDAAVLKGGVMEIVPPFSGSEKACLPSAGQPCEFVYTVNSEMATLPSSLAEKGLVNCDHKEGFPPAFLDGMRTLTQTGLVDNTETDFMDTRFSPRAFLEHMLLLQAEQVWNRSEFHSWIWVEAFGEKDGRPSMIKVESGYCSSDDLLPQPGYESGLAAAIVVEMIAQGLVKDTGVLSPEQCIEPGPFFRELTRRGIRVSATTQVREDFGRREMD